MEVDGLGELVGLDMGEVGGFIREVEVGGDKVEVDVDKYCDVENWTPPTGYDSMIELTQKNPSEKSYPYADYVMLDDVTPEVKEVTCRKPPSCCAHQSTLEDFIDFYKWPTFDQSPLKGIGAM